MAIRIEYDLPGDREIPTEAYWDVHTLRAVESFKISNQKTSGVPQFIYSMMMMKKAATQVNDEPGTVKLEIAAAIEKACGEVLLKGRYLDQFPSDAYQGGTETSVNMDTNEVIANLTLEISGYEKGRYDIINPMGHVNVSQPTNDAHPTGLRLTMYYSADELLEKLMLLKDTFVAEAGESKGVLEVGRTQLQDAVPVTVGREFQSFQALLEEGILNLDRTHALLLKVNLGATAIGAGMSTPKGYATLAMKKLSETSGSGCKLTKNLIETTSDCGAYVMVHGALKRTAVKLPKICNDLYFLSSGPHTGLEEISLPEMRTGPSTIPAKVNLVVPETVNQVRFKVIGNNTTITFVVEVGQLQLDVMKPVIAQCMSETISLLSSAIVNLAEKCAEGITVNREACERYMFNSIGPVTYLNPCIGHGDGDLVGKICAQTGKGVCEVMLERDLLSEMEPDRILSPEDLADLRRST